MNELSPLRLLIVEDNEDCLLLLESFLGLCGAEVTACESAAQALQKIAQAKPDVIISDIMMPDHDGYWFLEQVRQLRPEQGGDTPAIALTARTRDEDRVRALEAGFQLHMTKPAICDELISAIRRLAGRISPLAG